MTSSRLSLRHIRRLTTSAGDATANATPPPTTKFSISKAKTTLKKIHDPDKALEIYSNVFDHSTSPTSSRYAQELTVRRLAKCNRFTDIETLIESHKTDPKVTEEPYYSTLIRSYGRASMYEQALKTYEEMDYYKTPRTVFSFNVLLNACLQCKKPEKVQELFDEMPKRYETIKPDKVSYGILIKSYCDSNAPEKGVEIVREMESQGLEVTTIAFTTILNSLYKKGEIELAESLWEEMVKKGCELDNTVYNVRIMSAQKESPERVKELIEEMSGVGLKPDTISYNYLMTAYCEKGMLDEAKKVYEGLQGYGCAPNAATFRTLVFHLCRGGLYEQGYTMFKKSVNMKKIPDFNTLKHLVVGLVKDKKLDQARRLVRTVKKKYPSSFLNAWVKLEEELGIGPVVDEASSSSAEKVVDESSSPSTEKVTA